MEAIVSGHSVYQAEYLVVWIPKYGYRILNSGIKSYLEKLLLITAKAITGCEVVEYNFR